MKLSKMQAGLLSVAAVALVILIFISAIFMNLYSNYQICKEYFPKVSPIVCMVSSKTKVVPR